MTQARTTALYLVGVVAFSSILLDHSIARAWDAGEGLRLRGRLQMRWGLEDQAGDQGWTDALLLRRARVDARWQPTDWLRLVVEADAADGRLESKDVYARIEVHDLLRISAGQLKKPFSRLRMSSPFDLVIPERGLLDRYAVGGTYYGGYGGRDIGVMLSGMWKGPIKLRYYFGAFNNRLDDPPYHRDYVARLQVRIIKGLTLAANVSHKRYDEEIGDVADPDYQVVTRGANLFGADLRLTLAGFCLDLEGAYGDNAGADGGLPVVVSNGLGHTLYGAHATVSYRLALGESFTLVPAVVAEVFDPDDEQDNDDVFRWAAALSAHIGKHVCVALSGERVDRSESYATPTNVFIQLSLEL